MNKLTEQLRQAGVSLWLDNITRSMLDDGTLAGYIQQLQITGLTSNPSIYDKAIGSGAYDDSIHRAEHAGKTEEALFFELALQDLQRAADLFRPVYERSDGLDGWVSLEVSPLLAYDTAATVAQARDLFAKAARPNLMIKIPGTRQGLLAVEQTVAAGIPVNVTLLFSAEQYRAAADAWLRGVEQRVEAGLKPDVRSVASLFISRWDRAASVQVEASLRNQLGIAVAARTQQAYNEWLSSDRVQRVSNFGARPQRLLWASTGTKDKSLEKTFYAANLVAPHTVNTLPEPTLLACDEPGELALPLAQRSDFDGVIAAHERAGIHYHALAEQLQSQGADAFVDSWNSLLHNLQKVSEQAA